MALSKDTVWEARSTGSATNGGGFRAGASGVDRSQQDAAHIAVNDAVANGTTAVTSATANFTANDVGNVCYIAGQWYEVITRDSATQITVDRTIGAASGLTLNLGGAVTLAALATAMVSQNKAFVRGSFNSAASLVFDQAGVNPSATVMHSRLIGYTTTRTDGGRFTVTLTAGSVTGLQFSNNGWSVENAHVDCASQSSSIGVQMNGNGWTLRNVKVSAATLRGIFPNNSQGKVISCEVTGCTSACEAAIRGGNSQIDIVNCYVYDNACPGVRMDNQWTLTANIIVRNTGASSDGVFKAGQQSTITNNTIHGNGRDGIRMDNDNSFCFATLIRNNILSGNGGYGLRGPAAQGIPAVPWLDGNAFWSNTSGNRFNVDDTTANPVNGVAPYTNVRDVVCSADPYTNAAGGDLTINETAGGGALLRGTAAPGPFPGTSMVGGMDFGALQTIPVAPVPPTAPTLAVSDNRNGTGGVATITGSVAGSTNNVYTLRDGTSTWVLSGTRIGNGTVNLALAKGYYWVKVDSLAGGNSASSNVARLPVTDDADGTHHRCSEAVKAAIEELAIPELKAVYHQTIPTAEMIVYPCIAVWYRDGETADPATNDEHDVGYVVRVSILENRFETLANPPVWALRWRERIRRKVMWKNAGRLLGPSGPVWKVNWQGEAVIDESLPQYNKNVSDFAFVCVSREGT